VNKKSTVVEAKKEIEKGKYFDIRSLKLKAINDKLINEISQKAISGL